VEGAALVGLEHFIHGTVHDELAMIEPERAGAKTLQRAEGVGDAEDGAALIADFENLVDAFGLELLVADGEDFINDENLRIEIDGDGEGEAEHHTVGIGAERLVDEIVEFGKVDNGFVKIAGLFSSETEKRGIEANVFAASEIGMKAGAEFEERGDAPIDDHIAGGGRSKAGNEAEKGAFTGAVRADDGDGLAVANGKIDVLERVEGVRIRLAHHIFEVVPDEALAYGTVESLGDVFEFNDIHRVALPLKIVEELVF